MSEAWNYQEVYLFQTTENERSVRVALASFAGYVGKGFGQGQPTRTWSTLRLTNELIWLPITNYQEWFWIIAFKSAPCLWECEFLFLELRILKAIFNCWWDFSRVFCKKCFLIIGGVEHAADFDALSRGCQTVLVRGAAMYRMFRIPQLGFIGAGTLAEALAKGWVAAGTLQIHQVIQTTSIQKKLSTIKPQIVNF